MLRAEQRKQYRISLMLRVAENFERCAELAEGPAEMAFCYSANELREVAAITQEHSSR